MFIITLTESEKLDPNPLHYKTTYRHVPGGEDDAYDDDGGEAESKYSPTGTAKDILNQFFLNLCR